MLKRVSIQNFKSLKDVTLDLQKVNLLIGPNNSGKTNFLKALEFLSGQNVSNKKSLDVPYNIPFRNVDADYPSTVSIRLTFTQALSQRERYVALLPTAYNDYQLRCWPDDVDDELVLRSLDKPEQTQKFILEPELSQLFIYKIDVNTLVDSYPLLPDNDSVNANASNVVAFLDSIRDKYPDTFNAIQNDIAVCLSEFNQIRFDNIKPTEGQRKLHGDKTFKVLGLYNKTLRSTFWADELSEGTLYFVALLCIINQPNPPKLLLLEEPEKGIHPRRIREVMNFIRRLVSEKDIQVIMTTHSPLLLDEFAESPESVFVFDKDEEGATIVRNLQRDVIEPANEKNERLGIPPVPYTEALGEYWTIGFLGGVPHEAV